VRASGIVADSIVANRRQLSKSAGESSEDASGASDDVLVSRAQTADRAASRELFRRYHRKVFGLAYSVLRSREDAEDVAQEAFVKAFTSLSEFKGDSAFYTWLYRITYNLSIDLKRKVARRGGATVEYEDTSSAEHEAIGAAPIEGPSQVLYRKQQRQLISDALAELSEEHRVAVVLREIEGLSYEEIARTTGVSQGTVMSRLFYARKRLQQRLKAIGPSWDGEGESVPHVASAGEKGRVRPERLGRGQSVLGALKAAIRNSMIF
jgi:RNA polymerase sigma-70 factor (ECF subfamily)